MNFHGNEIDVDSAYRFISEEFSKRELSQYVSEKDANGEFIGPQEQCDVMLDAYFQAYGHLLGISESYIRTLLSQNYPGD